MFGREKKVCHFYSATYILGSIRCYATKILCEYEIMKSAIRIISVIIVILLILFSVIIYILNRNFIYKESEGVSEVLTLLFNYGGDVFTSQDYVGWVYLTISGTGQITPSIYSDGFYTFGPDGKRITIESRIRNHGFRIDGNIADDLTIGNVPQYNINHLYADMSYYVGEQRRRLSFNISDGDVSDNLGELVIEISRELPESYRGR